MPLEAPASLILASACSRGKEDEEAALLARVFLKKPSKMKRIAWNIHRYCRHWYNTVFLRFPASWNNFQNTMSILDEE